MSDTHTPAASAIGAVRVPTPSKYARNAAPERDAAILRLAGTGATYDQIGRAVGMKASSVQKRLYALRERIADEAAEAEERTRKHLGFPKDLPCPICRRWRTCRTAADRYHPECRAVAAHLDTGVRGTVAGIRRRRG